MIDWWLDPFIESSTTRLALYVCAITVVTLAIVGTWVVLRGLSFFGEALAHGVLPGVVIAFLAGFDVRIGAFLAAAAMVVGMNVLRSRSPLPEDTSVGVLFVGFLALAIVIITANGQAGFGDLDRFLFGGVASVQTADLWRQVVTLGVVGLGVGLLYRALLVATFDETLASTLGLRPELASGALLGLVAVAIVSSFEVVGSLLVFAYLIAPAATAALLARRVPSILAVGSLLGICSVVIGLVVSYHYESAPEATMALVSVCFFLIAVLVRAVRADSPRPSMSG